MSTLSRERTFTFRFLSQFSALKPETVTSLVAEDFGSLASLVALDLSHDLNALHVSSGQRALLRHVISELQRDVANKVAEKSSKNAMFKELIETAVNQSLKRQNARLNQLEALEPILAPKKKRGRKRKSEARKVCIDLDEDGHKTEEEVGDEGRSGDRQSEEQKQVLSYEELLKTVKTPEVRVSRLKISEENKSFFAAIDDQKTIRVFNGDHHLQRPYKCQFADCLFSSRYPFSLTQHEQVKHAPNTRHVSTGQSFSVLKAMNSFVKNLVDKRRDSGEESVREKIGAKMLEMAAE